MCQQNSSRKKTYMNHKDHVYLLQKGVPGQGGTWADLGPGAGAFTLALADLLGPTGHIFSVDRDRGALREQDRAMRANLPATTADSTAGHYSERLNLPPLDAVVMR